jgi:hypothetical protein
MGPAPEKMNGILHFTAVLRNRRWLTGALCIVLSGCVGIDGFLHKPEPVPTGKPCQIVATWNKEVLFVPDPASNGIPRPGISGRIYLFGPEFSHPLTADGKLTVEMFVPVVSHVDGTHVKAELQRLESWEMDQETLRKLIRKDMIGWGYSVFLPWGTYRPETNQVRLKVRFEGNNEMPVFTESRLTLMKPKGKEI